MPKKPCYCFLTETRALSRDPESIAMWMATFLHL